MANIKLSMKRVQINKANSSMVLTIAAAAFIVVFSLVAARALLNKSSYQGKVISAKAKAVDQLEANITASNTLVASYKAFVGTPENVIGGNPNGTGERDGDNAKITLDALPSQYDFPALASSLEKILLTNNYKIDSITGIDDEVAQNTQKELVGPLAPVPMPFTVGASTNLAGARSLLETFEKSIRPIKVESLQASGSNGSLKLTVTAVTYFQPQKTLDIKMETIK